MNKFIAIWSIVLLCSSIGFSQGKHKKIDSLKIVWQDQDENVRNRISAGQQIARSFKNVHPDSAIIILRQVEELAADDKTPEDIETYMLLAGAYRTQGNYPMALDAAQQALKLSQDLDHQNGVANAYTSMGQTMERQEDFEKSLEYHKKALSINKKIGDPQRIGMNYSNLGNIYGQLDMLQISLDTYETGLKYLKEANDEHGISVINGNMGYVHSIQGDSVLENGGSSNVARSFYLQSIKRSTLAQNYFESAGNRNFVLNCKSNIGLVYNSMEEYRKALSICQEAYAESIDQNIYPMERDACLCLHDAHKGLGNSDSALFYFERFVHLKDSLLDKNEQRSFLEKELSFNYERQAELAEELHQKELENQKEQAKKDQYIKNITITFISIGLIGLLVFSIFLYNRFKLIRKQNVLIEHQKEDLRLQKEIVDHKNTEITDSIMYAKRIQTGILPADKLVKKYLPSSFILYKPKDIVAGDFYWLEPQDKRVLFAAADCTGHGVPGAMVSVICNHALNRSVREFGLTDPAMILDKTRELVIAEFEKSEEEVNDGMDIALVSLEGNLLKYAGAHNPLWIIRKDAAEVEEIKADKQPIGRYAALDPFTENEIKLNPGDTFYIFSDGFADQFGGEKGKKFKTANFKKLLISMQSEKMDHQKQLIDDVFEKWKGNLEQLDDICVIGVRV